MAIDWLNFTVQNCDKLYKRFGDFIDFKNQNCFIQFQLIFAQAMAKTKVQLLYGDCLMHYTDTEQKVINAIESYVNLVGLQQCHEQAKYESLSKVSGGIHQTFNSA